MRMNGLLTNAHSESVLQAFWSLLEKQGARRGLPDLHDLSKGMILCGHNGASCEPVDYIIEIRQHIYLEKVLKVNEEELIHYHKERLLLIDPKIPMKVLPQHV